MRQAGIIAAAGLYALDHNVVRLADDHARARRLAAGLAVLPGIAIDVDGVVTNLVFFRVRAPLVASAFVADLLDRGVRMSAMGNRVRAVTHLDVDDAGIDRALTVTAEALRAS